MGFNSKDHQRREDELLVAILDAAFAEAEREKNPQGRESPQPVDLAWALLAENADEEVAAQFAAAVQEALRRPAI